MENPEMAEEKEKLYNKIKLRISISDIILNILLITFLAFSGISPLIEDFTDVIQNVYLHFLLFILAIGVIVSIIELPIDFYSSYIIEHRFNLSNQSISKWIIERIKSTGISLVIGIPVALVFYYFLRITGNLWWLYFSVVMLFFAVFLARIAPVVIFPIFYKFKELEDSEIRQKIMNLLRNHKIDIKGFFTFNLSKDTKKANAGFTGIGKSRRIILSDTLVEKFTPDEIAVIFAHEMGHYRYRHILKNIILSSIIIFVSFFLCGKLYELTINSFGYRYIYEIAGIPILFFYLTLFSLIIMPFMNYISRRYEIQADSYAIDATGDSKSFISSMEKLAVINLADRDPHPLTEFMFYSHPSIRKRIEFACKHSK